MNKRYEVEYEDAPSGNVTFYNYKEPLMEFTGGYGFAGAIVFDTDTGKIQCHFCGEWFDRLENHIRREHALSADDYRRSVGLTQKTVLINEKIRGKMIEHGRTNKKVLANLRPGGKVSEETKEKIRATLKENRDELKNFRGTCPEQLIQRLVQLWRKLGRTPHTREIPFVEALRKTYGSLEEACVIAGIPFEKSKYHNRIPKYSEGKLIEGVRVFFDENNRLPRQKDYVPTGKRNEWNAITRIGSKKIFARALALDGRYRKVGKRLLYTNEELLNFLRKFQEHEGRLPSSSDCKRGLLPYASKYVYRFGSWKTAMEMAFGGSSTIALALTERPAIVHI